MSRWVVRSVQSLAFVTLAAASQLGLAAEANATTHALMIGVDAYQSEPRLQGAVADVRDVTRSLQQIGINDVQTLLDGEATREKVLAALQSLVASTHAGDTIILLVAGYGATDSTRGPVYLLSHFDPKRPVEAEEKIFEVEFKLYLHRLEALGAQAIFVSDTGFGAGIAREIDPRVAAPTYRTVKLPPLRDGLQGAPSSQDEASKQAYLHHTLWLAAVNPQARAPELTIEGLGARGALSYAFARALEGDADTDGDGILTTPELSSYVRQVVHQLSDQRQVVVASALGDVHLDIGSKSVGRGISVRPVGASAQTPMRFTIAPAEVSDSAGNDYDFGSTTADVSSVVQPRETTGPSAAPAATKVTVQGGLAAPSTSASIKLASLDGNTEYFKGLQNQEPVVFVAPSAAPDLTWDPRSHDVLAGPDVIARNIDSADLAGVVERSLVLGLLKQKGTTASQPIVLLPSDDLHTKGTRIEIEVSQLTNRYLVMFNLSGNGNVQLLYPLGSDPPQRLDPTYSVEFQVREPYGADHVVAVTSNQRMSALEKFLKQAGRRLSPDRLAEELGKDDGQTKRVGFVGLFTRP